MAYLIIYSEAMHMILSADSPDSEDLNDQKYSRSINN